jgi:ferrous iron transport protein B
MIDIANSEGIKIDFNALQQQLGVPVIPTIASRKLGIDELKKAIETTPKANGVVRKWSVPEVFAQECNELIDLLKNYHKVNEPLAFHEALDLLTTQTPSAIQLDRFSNELIEHVKKDHQRLDFLGIDRQSVVIEARYKWINNVCAIAVTQTKHVNMNLSDKIDRVLTHKVWGFVFFFALMTVMFQSIFTWAIVPMELIGDGFDLLGQQITRLMPEGDLRDLIVNGALAGVAAVVTFLPQILFLFLFLGLLEDTGYMARAAFIMDRAMSKVGLHGKSFIPLLSSFACAIPGIMATRIIESPKDRLVTMLVAPLMSCSARLPIYTLMIAAFIPSTSLFGILSLPALTMLSMYLLGLTAALTMAWLFKKTLLKSAPPVFIMELPPYKLPSAKTIVLKMWERARLFLREAGTIILGVSIVLWFLATYPRLENGTASEQINQSFAGRAGHLLEPLIRPLGFDWKIGIGLVGSILQREVFVSTMGTIYNIKNADEESGTLSLKEQLRRDKDPVTGEPTFTVLTAICLMVYYVLAMQCLSTIAVMRRETNGWKWPLFQFGYMTALAYGVTFIVYRVGLLLGLGT